MPQPNGILKRSSSPRFAFATLPNVPKISSRWAAVTFRDKLLTLSDLDRATVGSGERLRERSFDAAREPDLDLDLDLLRDLDLEREARFSTAVTGDFEREARRGDPASALESLAPFLTGERLRDLSRDADLERDLLLDRAGITKTH